MDKYFPKLSKNKATSSCNQEAPRNQHPIEPKPDVLPNSTNEIAKVVDYEVLQTDPENRPLISSYHPDIQNEAFAINMNSDSDSVRVNKSSKKSYDDLDLISDLPEFAISHILSFLPTKDAVRTCVLSTRWTYFWTSITELSFKDLKKNRDCKKITSDVFVKCHSLQKLHLEGCGIQIPNPVSLSSLKVLKLSCIEITGNPSNKLTLNLPSLKEYEEENCNWNGVKSVSFEVPLLEVLQITNISCSLPEMVFSAVRLTRLCYTGFGLTQNIHLLADHVASAEIRLLDSKPAGVQGMWNFVCKLPTTIVQCLKLSLNKAKVFAEMKYPFVDIPSFGRLVHLELARFPTNLLLDLLLKTPCLQTLILKGLYRVEERLNLEIVPDCLYTLKVVKFEIFVGDDDELSIAKLLVENGQVLEQISFSYVSCLKWKKKKLKEAKEKIFSFKRGKSLALVEFK